MTDFPVVTRSNFGRLDKYLADAEQAAAFEVLTGRKSVRASDWAAFEAFGVTLVEQEASK